MVDAQDQAFPTRLRLGMDLRTYIAVEMLAARIIQGKLTQLEAVQCAVNDADKLIAALNEKS